MANTTNYNWETPDDTDLVKDGAAAIRTLGSSVDTTTKALNPSTTLGDIEYRSATANTNTRLGIGTTGQILSVVAGVPAWVANDVGDITAVSAGTGISGGGTSGDITITNSMATAIDAKGDLIGGTGADTFSRLAVGANGTVLTADSAETTGLKWATPAGGASGLTFISRTTFSNVASVDIDPFNNTYETYLMIIENISCATTADDVLIRGRYSTTAYSGAEYYAANAYIKFSSTAWTWANSSAATSFTVMPEADASFPAQAAIYFANVGDASKLLSMYGNWSTRSGMQGGYIAGEINSSQTWGGIRLLSSSSNITGEVSFYGLAKA